MWYVGQKVVAVRDHSQGDFKKGDEFVVRKIGRRMCKCGGVILGVGIKASGTYTMKCRQCMMNTNLIHDGEFFLYLANMFAPITEISDYTAEELIKEIEIINPQPVES